MESPRSLADALDQVFDTPVSHPSFEKAPQNDGHIVVTAVDTPLGPMIAGATADALCLFEYADPARLALQVTRLRERFRCPVLRGENPLIARVRIEIGEYFAGTRQQFSMPLTSPGTPFQERVWAALLAIPYGETISYEQLAAAVDAPRGQRAVGLANGANRLAILIPCHRVINKSGKLGGYGGLLWRKVALLALEQGGQQSLLDADRG